MNEICQQPAGEAARQPPSVFTAFGDAFRQMSDLLFRAFNFTQWLVLGLVCFLAELDTASPGASFNYRLDRASMRDLTARITAIRWETAAVLIIIAAVIIAIVIAVVIVLAYVSCRFRFIYLEGILRARFDLGAQWRAHGARALSLFLFRLVAGFIELVLFVPLGLLVLLAIVFYSSAYLPYLVVLAAAALLVVLFASVIRTLLMDAVVPVMLFRDIPVLAAWRVVLSLVATYPLTFLGYVCVRWILGLAGGILVVAAGCCTCCIGFLPVIAQTISAPVHVTLRLFPVNLLWQMGERHLPLAHQPPAA